MTSTRREDHVPLPRRTEAIGRAVVESSIAAHKRYGPGLLERLYHLALAEELEDRGLQVQMEVPLAIDVGQRGNEVAFRIDLLVEGEVLIDVKAVEELSSVHEAQILTYLKLSGHRPGYLTNFNETRVMNGFRRFIL